MKFFISIFLMIILSFAGSLYLPWWSIAVACFLVSLFIHQRPGRSFLTGFLAIFILWGSLSFFISFKNEHLFAGKMSQILLQSNGHWLLITVTAILGAIVGGFSACTASFVAPKTRKSKLN